MDDNEWCSITGKEPFVCSRCDEPLVPKRERCISLATKVVESKVFQAFTPKVSEIKFVSCAKEKVAAELISVLSRYHQTTYERRSLAKEQLESLNNIDISISMKVFNTPELDGVVDKNAEHGVDKSQDVIYVLVISLFSALESALQEVNLVCDLKKGEREVSYKLLGKIPDEYGLLNAICKSVLNDGRFIYLNDLRNLLIHRRITLLASDVKYDLPNVSPFSPYFVKGECINYLPDRPLVEPGKESYKDKKEVKSTLRELCDYINDVIDNIYLTMFEKKI